VSGQVSFPPRGPLYPDLRGKVAIVTGGGRGIGRHISARLAREGVKVVVAGRTTGHLEAAAEEIRAAGGECEPVQADISEARQVDALFAAAGKRFGPPDVLVNNAARMVHGPDTGELSDDEWRLYVDTNVSGAMYCVMRAARAMAGRGGTIVNISTVGALRSHYGMLAYDITKAVMDSITRTVGIDLIRRGVRVNAVAPGATWKREPYDLGREETRKKIPIGRFAHGEEIASAVAFLASEESSYIVGQTICVDGGLTTQLTPPGQFV
jgi:meso-butanediol dehydrogenase/(S,S)-butanediol dehydrogenase/diacetyl reductase